MPRKGQITIPDRFCEKCGKQINKYEKPTNEDGKSLCYSCWRTEFPAKIWVCVDCDIPVPRKTKRCRGCNEVHRKSTGKYKRSEETKKRMSHAQKTHPSRIAYYKSRIGYKHKPETIEKMKKAWDSPEKREQVAARMKLQVLDLKWMKKLSELFSGENNPNWKGGIGKTQYTNGFTVTLKKKIRERDDFTCQVCDIRESDLPYSLSIHHIDYDKSNNDPINLITVCKRCNSLANIGREDWITVFNTKIST